LSQTSSSNKIFKFSFISSSSVFIFGFFCFILVSFNVISSLSIMILSLIAILVGGVQILADLGWMAILKANRPDQILSWKQAFEYVAEAKGQKIFLFPVLMDFLLIGLSSILLLRI
jgi:hypothetical protein